MDSELSHLERRFRQGDPSALPPLIEALRRRNMSLDQMNKVFYIPLPNIYEHLQGLPLNYCVQAFNNLTQQLTSDGFVLSPAIYPSPHATHQPLLNGKQILLSAEVFNAPQQDIPLTQTNIYGSEIGVTLVIIMVVDQPHCYIRWQNLPDSHNYTTGGHSPGNSGYLQVDWSDLYDSDKLRKVSEILNQLVVYFWHNLNHLTNIGPNSVLKIDWDTGSAHLSRIIQPGNLRRNPKKKKTTKKKKVTKVAKPQVWFQDLLNKEFYRGVDAAGRGVGAAYMGNGLYATWSKPAAIAFARNAAFASGRTPPKLITYRLKPGIKLLDNHSREMIEIKKFLGVAPWDKIDNPLFAVALTHEVQGAGYDGIIDSDPFYGMVVFDSAWLEPVSEEIL